jgi:signal transduction histidine kinase
LGAWAAATVRASVRSVRWRLILSLLSLLGGAVGRAETPQPVKNVVLLFAYRSIAPINAEWHHGIVQGLSESWSGPLNIEVEYLDLVHRTDSDYLAEWINLLKIKYAPQLPDVVIPVYGRAVQFLMENRDEVFPGVPVVFCSAPSALAELAIQQPRTTGVAFRFDYDRTVKTILQLLPRTKRLVILSGSSDHNRLLLQDATSHLNRFIDQISIDVWEGVPVDKMRGMLAELPGDTAILGLAYDRDASGNQYSTIPLFESLNESSSVPIFGLFDTLIGRGIIGGSVVSASQQGSLAGGLAAEVLRGRAPEELPVVGLDQFRMLFDWRLLQRFGISEHLLPPDAEILFRQPTTWELIGKYVIWGGLASLGQLMIIGLLLVSRSKRRAAERQAQQLAGKILSAQEDERSYLARELHDDVSQRLAAAAIDAGHIESQLAGDSGQRQGLADLKKTIIRICDDVHRISHHMHPAILDDFGLVEAIREECRCLELRSSIPIDVEAEPIPDDLSKGVTLCLFRVGQEAIWNAVKHSQASRIEVRIEIQGDEISLEVNDDGCGIATDKIECRQGLGLASIQERVRLLNGSVKVDSPRGVGTRLAVRVPMMKGVE